MYCPSPREDENIIGTPKNEKYSLVLYQNAIALHKLIALSTLQLQKLLLLISLTFYRFCTLIHDFLKLSLFQ